MSLAHLKSSGRQNVGVVEVSPGIRQASNGTVYPGFPDTTADLSTNLRSSLRWIGQCGTVEIRPLHRRLFEATATVQSKRRITTTYKFVLLNASKTKGTGR
nr:hypothetical protein CFP56_75537 [Quercus suber]